MAIVGWARVRDELYECADLGAEDGSRAHVLRNAQVVPASPSGAWAVTTDGRCAAFVRCDGKTDGKHLVAKEDIQSVSRRFIDDHKNVPVSGMKFPRMDQTIPDDYSSRRVAVRLDAKYLLALQRALHDDEARSVGLELFIGGPREPVIVQGDIGFGVLMPMEKVRDDAESDLRDAVDRFVADYKTADEPNRVVGEMIS